MDDLNVPIFSQAKLEYTKQLVDVLYMNMYDGVCSIYEDAKRIYIQKKLPVNTVFRSLLEQVPKWNTEIIESETTRIEKSSKCDWLDDLLTAVFISHTRILMSIGPNQNFNKINVTIPKTTSFIHKTYINIAREVWKNPYLFSEQVPGHEYQRNMKQLEDMIKLTIEDTIRRQLPIKEILREHLDTYDEPKQSQPAFDMKMLLDEIKKAQSSNANETDDVEKTTNDTSGEEQNGDDQIPIEEESSDDTQDDLESKLSKNMSIGFTKEDNEVDNEVDDSDVAEPGVVTHEAEPDVVTPEVDTGKMEETNVEDTPTPPFQNVDSYNDPDDPDESQIEKATAGIVLNDITEPVVEEIYDNADIVSPHSSPRKDDAEKLTEMMKELEVKPVITDQKIIPPSKTASVVKIDTVSDPLPPVETSFTSDTPLTSDTSSTPEKENDITSPFTLDTLYPTIEGNGKVEDILEQKPINKEVKETIIIKDESTNPPVNDKQLSILESPKETNAEVMKEIISLDKKDEKIDDTETLDNFFNDVQKMTNPMEPIQEESKYTLFEDAPDNE